MSTDTLPRASNLKQRAQQIYSRLPSVIQYRPNDINDPNADSQSINLRIILRLEHLQNILCIGRLLIRLGEEDRSDILAASFELVSNTLFYWTQREKLSHMRDDYGWLVSFPSNIAG